MARRQLTALGRAVRELQARGPTRTATMAELTQAAGLAPQIMRAAMSGARKQGLAEEENPGGRPLRFRLTEAGRQIDPRAVPKYTGLGKLERNPVAVLAERLLDAHPDCPVARAAAATMIRLQRQPTRSAQWVR